jgi:hypothetical protein
MPSDPNICLPQQWLMCCYETAEQFVTLEHKSTLVLLIPLLTKAL